jgi:hypothetical protein
MKTMQSTVHFNCRAVMKSSKVRLTILGIALLCGACSMFLKVDLFNNTGVAIVVHAEGNELALEQAKFVEFRYPGDSAGWTFRLSTARCEYLYRVPRTLEHYARPPGVNPPLKAQVEPDFSVHWLPPTVNEVGEVAKYASLQPDGFPLHPESISCRP